jgi:hypothetical protein
VETSEIASKVALQRQLPVHRNRDSTAYASITGQAEHLLHLPQRLLGIPEHPQHPAKMAERCDHPRNHLVGGTEHLVANARQATTQELLANRDTLFKGLGRGAIFPHPG